MRSTNEINTKKINNKKKIKIKINPINANKNGKPKKQISLKYFVFKAEPSDKKASEKSIGCLVILFSPYSGSLGSPFGLKSMGHFALNLF